MTKRFLLGMAALGLVAGAAGRARAGMVLGPSGLLGSDGLSQLEGWLGEGELTLTNIFDHVQGDGKTSYAFHTAADGRGRTFTLVEVLDSEGIPHQVIGGYNPQSWHGPDSIALYNLTYDNAERTAFLFNLTSGEKQAQNLFVEPNFDADSGKNQTLNYIAYGPTFGGGLDLNVHFNLVDGHSFSDSYGGALNIDNILMGGTAYSAFRIGSIQIFTISAYTSPDVATVPEPASLATAGLGVLMGLGYAWRRRRRAAA